MISKPLFTIGIAVKQVPEKGDNERHDGEHQ